MGQNGYVGYEIQTYVIRGNGRIWCIIQTLDIIEKSFVTYGTASGGLLGGLLHRKSPFITKTMIGITRKQPLLLGDSEYDWF